MICPKLTHSTNTTKEARCDNNLNVENSAKLKYHYRQVDPKFVAWIFGAFRPSKKVWFDNNFLSFYLLAIKFKHGWYFLN